MTDYFPRRLRFENTTRETVTEDDLIAATGARVILGEPGMGKTTLMGELGRRLGIVPVTAGLFIHSDDPASFRNSGAPGTGDQPLLIDSLDEASGPGGDAVRQVIARLRQAGAPPFILACRAQDWRSATTVTLRQVYPAAPLLCHLEPFNRKEAAAFLVMRFPKIDPEPVLAHLDQHTLAGLYGNPQTLELIGKVAATGAGLPATRAGLFQEVCQLSWSEHNEERLDSALGKLSETDALATAGALMAGLLFAGAEAISSALPAQIQSGDIHLPDFLPLTGAAAAAVLSSKLFRSAGTARAAPVHRVIAEYLGARWLANAAAQPRAQRRLLRQLHTDGAVPASLRGLHAWLAHHSPEMAGEIIAADPFGVLRYGDTARLSRDARWHGALTPLAAEWLVRFPGLPRTVEVELVRYLLQAGATDILAGAGRSRAGSAFTDDERRLSWRGIDVIVRFDEVEEPLTGIGATDPGFIWNVRDLIELERFGRILPLSTAQARWIVSEFRGAWPQVSLRGTSWGATNPYNAADFLNAMIAMIADRTDDDAVDAMAALAGAKRDSYTDTILHLRAEQRQ